jgi:hypothetical protein
MAALKATRGAQAPLVAAFTFDVSTAVADTMPTVVGNVIAGAIPAYNATGVSIGAVASQIFDVINLPVNAVVIGGEVVVETAVVGPTVSTISVGDAGSATRYLGATNLLAAARTALVPTGFVGTGGNIRITVNNTVAVATAGKVTVRVLYVIRGRQSEASGN